jgi:imidazolonepropionase-like amidohydrolase
MEKNIVERKQIARCGHIRSVFLAAMLCLALLAAGTGIAADLVITNARLFSGADANVIEGASIVVAGERIESVSQGTVDSAGAEVIDAGGRTVLPGLIDAHVHLFFDLQGDMYFPTSDPEVRSFIETRLPGDLEMYLEQGFTSILSAIDFWPQIVEVRKRVLSGEFKGPRLFIGGGVFVAPGGHYVCRGLEEEDRRRWCDEHISVTVENPAQVRDGVGRYAASGVDLIVYDGRTNSPTLSVEVVAALVDEAHRQQLPVLVHNSDAAGLDGLTESGIDGFIHPPGGTDEDGDFWLERLGSQRIPLGITIGETEEAIRANELPPDEIAAFMAVRQNVLTLLKAGAVPIFASDIPGASPKETLPIVLRSLSELGLSNAEVLHASTRDPARLIIRRQDLGTVEPGNLADMIIVDGNPLEDLGVLRNVEIVIKGGKIVVDKR